MCQSSYQSLTVKNTPCINQVKARVDMASFKMASFRQTLATKTLSSSKGTVSC